AGERENSAGVRRGADRETSSHRPVHRQSGHRCDSHHTTRGADRGPQSGVCQNRSGQCRVLPQTRQSCDLHRARYCPRRVCHYFHEFCCPSAPEQTAGTLLTKSGEVERIASRQVVRDSFSLPAQHPCPLGGHGLRGLTLLEHYPWACSKAWASKGTHVAKSATMPISASAKICAFASELIAKIVPAACVPQM